MAIHTTPAYETDFFNSIELTNLFFVASICVLGFVKNHTKLFHRK